MDFDERMKYPGRFVLDKDKIAIGIINREYGVLCPNCGSSRFSEDDGFTKIFCSDCKKTLAVRAVADVRWVNEEEIDE